MSIYSFWNIIIVLGFIIELVMPGFGFIFCSISALITEIILTLNIVDATNYTVQAIIFFTNWIVLMAIFYKPLKKLLNKGKKFEEHQTAIIESDTIKKKQTGIIKWSGTVTNAKILKTSQYEKFNKGDIVQIIEFKGNTAIIDKEK